VIREQWTYVLWCVMALVLVGTGLLRAERWRRSDRGSRAPDMLTSALIWLGIIMLIVLLYQGAAFWSALGSLFR
jgi:hypothetical protein